MKIMHSMEYDDEDKIDASLPLPMEKPDFPCNMQFSLTEKEFKKLPEVDPQDAVEGGTFHFWGMARITSVTHGPDGRHCVCCQIEDFNVESEDAENED